MELAGILETLLPAVATAAIGILTLVAASVSERLKARAALQIEALRRDALHKAIRSHVEALAASTANLPGTPDERRRFLLPVPAMLRETNPDTVAAFAELSDDVIVNLGMQYLPRAIVEARAAA